MRRPKAYIFFKKFHKMVYYFSFFHKKFPKRVLLTYVLKVKCYFRLLFKNKINTIHIYKILARNEVAKTIYFL